MEQMFKLDELHCYADGNPEVTRQWYFGSDLVNASELLTRGRSGTYTAVFANTIGVIETSVKVTVECKSSNYFFPSLNVNVSCINCVK